jgi:hypothetical protein
MTEPALTFTDDPAHATPQQRAEAIAAIFAAAFLRMRPALAEVVPLQPTAVPVEVAVTSRCEKVSESGSNHLALGDETSVTVTAG